jgi:hypothetical protein
MTHHRKTLGDVLAKLESEALEISSEDPLVVLLSSVAISMKRIADYMDEIEYVVEPEETKP